MRGLKPWELTAWLAAFAVFSAFAFSDIVLLHPGICDVDETAALRFAVEARPPGGWHPAAFTGSWARLIQGLALSNSHWPGLGLLPALSLLGFILETCLLAALTARLFSQRAALGAALFSLACAFSLARSRSLLSFTLLPLEWLAIAALLLLARGRARSLASGALLGLFVLDYEAWPAAWLGLALAAPGLARRFDFRLMDLCLGFALGLASALGLSQAPLASYLETRSSASLAGGDPWIRNLLSFVWGGPSLPSLGVSHHPAIPLWSWPLLLTGCVVAWKRERWVLVLAAAGALPLLLPSPLAEPNRGIAAWIPLALAAGLGFERALESGRARLGMPAALGLALAWIGAGAALEARAFLRSQDELAPRHYSASLAGQEAGRWMREEGKKGNLRLLSRLGYQRASDIEWLSGVSADPTAAQVLALIPWEALPALGEKAGDWRVFEAPGTGAKAFLLEPREPWRSRLLKAEEELGAAWASLNRYDLAASRAKLLALLERKGLDPWVRTALWQRLMTVSAILGQVDEAMVDRLLEEKLLHAGPLNHPSYYLMKHRPDLAARLRARAAAMDARMRFE